MSETGSMTLTLTEFLLARVEEDEAAARDAVMPGKTWENYAADHDFNHDLTLRFNPVRVLAECEAKRRIVEMHQAWPVLVQQQPTFEPVDGTDPGHYAYRASQQIAWLTEQEYRVKFGDEPPTAPMLAALAAVYADHPDYREEWKP